MSDSAKAMRVIEDGDYREYMKDDNGKNLSIPDTFRRAAKGLVEFHDKAKVALAEVLYEIYTNDYHKDWGFDNFQSYVESPELDFQYRQAKYLVDIWGILHKQRGIPVEVIRNKSWSKLKEIVGAAKIGEIPTDVITGMIEDSDKLTVQEVQFAVRSEIETVRKSGVEIEKATRMTFTLFPEQLENLETALRLSTDISASEKSGANLDYICTSFIASHLHGAPREEIKRLVKELEGIAKVKILVADDDGVIYSNKEFKDK